MLLAENIYCKIAEENVFKPKSFTLRLLFLNLILSENDSFRIFLGISDVYLKNKPALTGYLSSFKESTGLK